MQKINLSGILIGLMALFLWAFPAEVLARYDVDLNFLVPNPSLFPVGPLVPGDLADASEIEFGDVQPFFVLNVSGTGSEELRMLVQFEAEDGVIFTISSGIFPISDILGQPLNNQQLAGVQSIHFDTGSEQINARRLLPFISGSLMAEGVYTLTILISEHNDWDQALSDNEGVGSTYLWAQNTNQVSLLQPVNNDQLQMNPQFQWVFPRREGIIFNLIVTNGIDLYADVNVEIQDEVQYSEVTTFTYTGTGDQRPLDPNETYFWTVTAFVPTMFGDLIEEVTSSAYRFTYSPPGGGGLIGGNIGGDYHDQPGTDDDQGILGFGDNGNPDGGHPRGGDDLSGGPLGDAGNEGDHPPEQHLIFTLLHNMLTAEEYNIIRNRLGDLSQYNLNFIRIGDQEIALDDLAVFLVTNNLIVEAVSVQE